MPQYQSYVMTNMAEFIANLAAFGGANGWTTVNSTSTEITMTKDGGLFSVWQRSGSAINLRVEVAGVSSAVLAFIYLESGYRYHFISCGSSLYIGRDRYPSFAGIGKISNKIGVWSGGYIATGNDASSFYFHNTESPYYRQLLYNDAWTSTGNSAQGRIVGSIGVDYMTQSPNKYNAAIVPIPVMMFMYNVNTSYIHPLGFVDHVFRAGGNNLYSTGDIVTIGGEPHVCFPDSALLFKLG